MAVKPLDDRVLVKQSEAEETTSGGIVLPDTAKEKPQRGTVVEVGPGKLLDSGERGSMSVKKGDEIFYAKFGGTEIRIDREDYVILRESDVLAVIEASGGGKKSSKKKKRTSSKKKSRKS